MHDLVKRPKRVHVKEIPLAPILDLLTVVIFFLILSASFIEIRQNTLPPSSTSIVSGSQDAFKELPLNPKLLMTQVENSELLILLKWGGKSPAQIEKRLKFNSDDYSLELREVVAAILKEYSLNHPGEINIQLGWSKEINYQVILNVVDGVMPITKDIVFLSPEDTSILISKSTQHEI